MKFPQTEKKDYTEKEHILAVVIVLVRELIKSKLFDFPSIAPWSMNLISLFYFYEYLYFSNLRV